MTLGARQVVYDLGAADRASHSVRVPHVARDDGGTAVSQRPGGVLASYHRNDIVPVGDEPVDQPRADESGGARYQEFHVSAAPDWRGGARISVNTSRNRAA